MGGGRGREKIASRLWTVSLARHQGHTTGGRAGKMPCPQCARRPEGRGARGLGWVGLLVQAWGGCDYRCTRGGAKCYEGLLPVIE